MSAYFVLPLGLYLFNVGAVALTRVIQHRFRPGNPGRYGGRGGVFQYFEKFLLYDLPKVGVESVILAAGIVLIATIDTHSQIWKNPPVFYGSAPLGFVLVTVALLAIFGATLALWVSLEGHQGARGWNVTIVERLKWLGGLMFSGILGVLGLSIASRLC